MPTPASRAVAAASRWPEQQPVRRSSSSAAVDEVTHVQQHVRAPGQLREPFHRRRVPAEDDGPAGRGEPVREAGELGLHVDHLGHVHPPAAGVDAVAVGHLPHLRVGPAPRHQPAAGLVHEVAARVHGAGLQVGPEGAVGGEQPARHVRRRRRAVDPQLGDPAGALVPARQHQVGVVDAVVVVQVRQEEVVDGGQLDAGLEHAPHRGRAAVEDQGLAAGPHQVAGAAAVGQGRGRARAQEVKPRRRGRAGRPIRNGPPPPSGPAPRLRPRRRPTCPRGGTGPRAIRAGHRGWRRPRTRR